LVLITLSKDTILLLLLNVQIKAKSLGERKIEFTVHLKRSQYPVLYYMYIVIDQGVAARQRSRYLRFARPPQEKQLIEARKKVMKEKKARTLFR